VAANALSKGEMMSKRLLLFVVLLAIGVCAGAGPAAAKSQPGTVDPSFGTGGSVVQPGGRNLEEGFYGPFGEDMVIGLEDEVLELQSERQCVSSGACSAKLFVERYWRDGVLDEVFGVRGRSASAPVASLSIPSFSSRPISSLAVTPTDEVVVATLDAGTLVLFRFDRLGNLVPWFGVGGRVTTTIGGLEGQPRLAITADDKILVTASSPQPDGRSIVWLARFSQNGAPDPSFGAGLAQAVAPGTLAIGAPSAASLARSSGERIVLGGVGCCPAKRSSVYFGRRDPDGNPLPPFSDGKPWRSQKVGEPASVGAVLALARGRIALVARSKGGPFVLRLLPSGRRDRSFGKRGMVRLKHLRDGVSALADSAGNIYVAGYRSSGEEFASSRALVVRVTRRGRLDRRFGMARPGYTPLPEAMSDPLAMGFQSTGKLVVFGQYIGACVRSCPLPNRVLMRLYTSRRQGP
jgi:uncharacterized delta-60 repeat protein